MTKLQMDDRLNEVKAWLTPILLGIVAYFLVRIHNKVDYLGEQFYEANTAMAVFQNSLEHYEERIETLEKKLEAYENQRIARFSR